jgi:hypothetical protein
MCTATDGQGTGMTIFQWVAQLNSAGFAGHTDWRIPNVKELESIVDFGTDHPAIATAFNTNCVSGCTVLTCSCTYVNVQSSHYWSSTTNHAQDPGHAFLVLFTDGFVSQDFKVTPYWVRAVRGGL